LKGGIDLPEENEFKNDTPVNAPLKEKMRMEKRKIREMPFKKKCEYIWDYYKFHIIAGILILALIGSVINSIVNPRPQNVLFIAWSTGFATDEQLTGLTSIMQYEIIEEKANESIEITLFHTMSDDPSLNSANIQRLAAMIAAGMIDVFILDSEMIDEYSSVGYIQPMDPVLEIIQSLNPNIHSRINEELIKANYTSVEGYESEQIMGIDISNSRLLKELNFFEFEKYFSLSITAENIENTAHALIMFFE